jgi:hypothetical protein
MAELDRHVETGEAVSGLEDNVAVLVAGEEPLRILEQDRAQLAALAERLRASPKPP